MNFLKKVYLHIKRKYVFFCVNKLYAGTKHFKKKTKLLRSIRYKIGDNTKIVGPLFITGNLILGNNCWVGAFFKILGNGNVIIGDNCDIAPEVCFLTGGHEIGDCTRRAGNGEIYTISVGNGTWIGARSIFVKNIQIGDANVIACGSVVHTNTPANCLIAGVPAKIKKEYQ